MNPAAPVQSAPHQPPRHAAPAEPDSEALSRRSKRRRLLVGGIVVAVVALLAGAGAIAFTTRTPDPAKVATSFFAAVASGDASTVASLLADPPSDPSLITDTVLQKSNELAPIENVAAVKADATHALVSFTLGGRPVQLTVEQKYVDKQWLVAGALSKLNLASWAIPLKVDGTVPASKVPSVLPGTYELTTGNPYVELDPATRVLTVATADGITSTGAATLVLQQSGVDLMMTAARDSLTACLARVELRPDGCPYYMYPDLENGAVAPVMSTLKITQDGDQFAGVMPQLRSSQSFVAIFAFKPNMTWTLESIKDGAGWTFPSSPVHPSQASIAQMDFGQATPAFRWVAQ